MIWKVITLFFLCLATVAVFGQQVAHPPTPAEIPSTTEHLNDAEKISLQYIQEQQRKLQAEFIAWENSVRSSHPGYHLSRTTPLNGELYPDPKPAKTAPR